MDPATLALLVQLQVGDLATVDIGVEDWHCARVSYIDIRPGGIELFWLVLEQNPPRPVVRARFDKLRPGCDTSSAWTK
jgi:hypothetical protein